MNIGQSARQVAWSPQKVSVKEEKGRCEGTVLNLKRLEETIKPNATCDPCLNPVFEREGGKVTQDIRK